MAVRGVRGAITVDVNSKTEIVEKTEELLHALIKKNDINVEDIASAIFSVTADLDAEFPAVAARKMGWLYTPLFCTREIPVQGSLPMCIRVLIHVNSEKSQDEMVQMYMRGAARLRPDLQLKDDKHYYES